MKNKRIIIKSPDGGCSILIPAPAMFDPKSRDRIMLNAQKILSIKATDEEALEWIIKKDVPQGAEYRVTDVSNLPQDRTFRDAWTDDNPTETVDINIEKAKEIKKDHLRIMRKPILDALDVEFMRATERNDNKAQKEIADKKQELRDVTKTELPSDVEKLKTFIPDCLSR